MVSASAPYSPGCDLDPNVECTRGESARLVQTIQFGYTFACNFFIVTFIALLVHSVYSIERRGDAYLSAGQERNRKNTKETAWQGIRYIGGFTLAYLWTYIFMVWNITSRDRGVAFVVLFYVHVILNPLAGVSRICYNVAKYASSSLSTLNFH